MNQEKPVWEGKHVASLFFGFLSWSKSMKDVNEDEENNVVDLNKDDEGMWWLCILSLRKIWMKIDEILCVFFERKMKNYQRKMKDYVWKTKYCVLVLFVEDGWRTAKERWKKIVIVER